MTAGGAGSATRTVSYAAGQQILAPGRGGGRVYVVRAGCVRLDRALPDGRAVTVGLLGPHTLFTQEDATDPLARGVTATALVASRLVVVPTDQLAALIADEPRLAASVVAGLTHRLTELQTLVGQLLARDASVRLAAILLGLATCAGRPTADGWVTIAVPLTHQGLARMVGSNRVTVTRLLRELQDAGAVRPLGRKGWEVRPDALRGRARSGKVGDESRRA